MHHRINAFQLFVWMVVVSVPGAMPLSDAFACAFQEQKTTDQTSDDETPSVSIKLLDDNGKPLADASVEKNYLFMKRDNDNTQVDSQILKTSSDGSLKIDCPGTPRLLQLHVRLDGYVPMYAQWNGAEFAKKTIPKDVTFQLVKGTTIGGTVKDDQGKPIPGVIVEVNSEMVPSANGAIKLGGALTVQEDGTHAKTDGSGRWSISNAPPSDVDVYVRLKHPKFVDIPANPLTRPKPTDSKSLRDQSATFVMSQGVEVSGIVLDRDDKPVGEGFIIVGEHPSTGRTQRVFDIQNDGEFKLPAMESSKARLTVYVPGFAPETRVVDVKPMMEDQEFTLEPGNTINIAVVDEQDKPIPGAMVAIDEWQGLEVLYNMPRPNPMVKNLNIPFMTDAMGVFSWNSAPKDPVTFQVAARGYDLVRPFEVTPGTETFKVKLRRSTKIQGRVVDESTDKPVSDFLVVPVDYRKDRPFESRQSVSVGRNGRFQFDTRAAQLRNSNSKRSFLIEAVGYLPKIYDPNAELAATTPATGLLTIKLAPKAWPTIQVLDPEGKPLAGRDVGIFSDTRRITLRNFRISNYGNAGIKTDNEGKAKVPASLKPFTVLVSDDSGYAEVEIQPSDKFKEVKLQKWARLEGTAFDVGGKTHDNRIKFEGIRRGHGPVTIIQGGAIVPIDENGYFRFEKLPPMVGQLRTFGRNEKREKFNRYSKPVNLEPGQTTNVEIGKGAVVSGKLLLSGVEVDHDRTHNMFMPIAPPKFGWPAGLTEIEGFDWRGGWSAYQQYIESDYYIMPRVILDSMATRTAKVNATGDFGINLAQPGEYDLAIYLYPKVAASKGSVVNTAAYAVKRIKVSDTEFKDGKLDLGAIELAAITPPKPGQTVEDFSFQIGNETKSITQFNSGCVLLDFWSPQCTVCKKSDKLLRAIADDPQFAELQIVSLTFDYMDDSQGRSDVEFSNWHSAKMESGSLKKLMTQLGIWSVPRFVLVDPQGRFVFQSDLESIETKLVEAISKK